MGSESRQRLRPWLEAKIESGTVPGLRWENREKTIFRIPWKHGGKQDWTPENSIIFMEWAKHTGKFREGIDEPDYATWKTRLRCAFNKAPDIREMKDATDLDTLEPYRVYELLPKKEKRLGGNHHGAAGGSPPKEEFKMEPNHYEVGSPEIPTVVSSMRGGNTGQMDIQPRMDSFPSDLKGIGTDDLVQGNSWGDELMTGVESGDVTMNSDSGICHESEDESMYAPTGITAVPQPEFIPVMAQHIDGHKMKFDLYYGDIKVVNKMIENPRGCRIFFPNDKTENLRNMYEEQSVAQVIGPRDMEQIPLPTNSALSLESSGYGDVLRAMERGVLVECVNGTVYATRLAKCAIYYSCQSQPEPTKLNRKQRTVIFDYSAFKETLRQYVTESIGRKPSANVYLGFGQKVEPGEDPGKALVSARITVTLASREIEEIFGQGPETPRPIDISQSDEIDLVLKMANVNTGQT